MPNADRKPEAPHAAMSREGALTRLNERLETEWLEATDRGDRWARLLSLTALVDIVLIEAQRELSHEIQSLRDTLPLLARQKWHLAGVKKDHPMPGPLTRAGKPTARLLRIAAGTEPEPPGGLSDDVRRLIDAS